MSANKKKIISSLIFSLWAFSLSSKIIPAGDLLKDIQPGKDGKIDVLTVFPHADDEMYCIGTLLKMKQQPQVRIHLLVMTRGELSPAKDVLQISSEKMAQLRIYEMRKVATVLDADSYVQWDYGDQTLSEIDMDILAQRILEVINQIDAELIIGYGPEGITRHPDHIAGSKATEIAFKKSNAKKLYYVNVPRLLYPIYRAYALTPGLPDTLPATIKVDVREFKKLKSLAITEHTSQKYFIGKLEQLEMSLIFNYEYFTLGASKP